MYVHLRRVNQITAMESLLVRLAVAFKLLYVQFIEAAKIRVRYELWWNYLRQYCPRTREAAKARRHGCLMGLSLHGELALVDWLMWMTREARSQVPLAT